MKVKIEFEADFPTDAFPLTVRDVRALFDAEGYAAIQQSLLAVLVGARDRGLLSDEAKAVVGELVLKS